MSRWAARTAGQSGLRRMAGFRLTIKRESSGVEAAFTADLAQIAEHFIDGLDDTGPAAAVVAGEGVVVSEDPASRSNDPPGQPPPL